MVNTQSGQALSVPIIDLGQEYLSLKTEIDERLQRILASGSYIMGNEGTQFEEHLAAYCGASLAIGVNSGTDAILIALRALQIGPGDDVIMPAMSFIATAEPVVQVGARPVFVDIDPLTYTIDPARAREKISSRTKAIIAVHLYGQMAEMTALDEMCRGANVPLIEDMAQSIGAKWRSQRSGSMGTLACLSFFPTKNLGACGDAGAVLTSNNELAERVRLLRNHGAKIKYQHEEIGYNSRLDELQAAILDVKLAHLDDWNDLRRRKARRYNEALKGLPLTLPTEAPDRTHVYHLYSVLSPERDALREFLATRGIATGLHYPAPLHLQPALRFLGYKNADFPNSERLAAQTLSLPLFPQLSEAQQEHVINAVKDFFVTGRVTNA